MRLTAIALVLVGCAGSAAQPEDAWSADGGFHGCRWIDPPFVGTCDHFAFQTCASWAIDMTAGSDLEAFGECWSVRPTGTTCSAAGVFGGTDGPGTCGADPACDPGFACARPVGSGAPTCVRCEP